jgi:2-keto-4-pentenoate hydratase/2-oxohepta-3-ene-1,7-dioic acid hydratase in catechol pathway
MKLVRFSNGSEARIGAVSGETVIDLQAALAAAAAGTGASPETAVTRIPSGMREFLAAGESALQAAQEAVSYATSAASDNSFSHPLSSVTLLHPIADPQKIICIGQNYRDHCEEQNQPLPERAIIFCKFASALNSPNKPVLLPAASEKVDYEAELVFVIGKRAKHVSEKDAKDYIAGYMCFNDISARDLQMHPAEKQWIRGKSPDTFAPCGPYLVTADEIADPHDLDIQLTLNGEVMQTSNTSNLIFGVYYLVSHLSKTMTLEPGDMVATGTPGGVGAFRNPPVWLKPGDEMKVTIEGLGTLTNTVEAD